MVPQHNPLRKSLASGAAVIGFAALTPETRSGGSRPTWRSCQSCCGRSSTHKRPPARVSTCMKRQTAESMSGRLAHQLNWTHFFDFFAFFGFMTLLLGAALTPRKTMLHYE